MLRRVIVASALLMAITASARAQSGSSGTSTATSPPAAQPSSSSSTVAPNGDTRPATTTFYGDTGLWFVPTAEVLGSGKWSGSVYRRGTNYIQGFTNVGDFAGTFAVGIKNRAEIFGSFLFDTRIDRDLRPLFTSNSAVGGVVDRYPFMHSTWSGDHIGDLYVGAKVNLASQAQQKKVALAVRGIVKVPTGDDTAGVSTGKTDVALDLIASHETAGHLDLSGFGGYEFREQPNGVDGPSGTFRWGAGASFPSRAPLRGVFELNGQIPTSSTVTLTGPTATPISGSIIGDDKSVPPTVSDVERITRATAGLTWQDKKGFFIGGGVSWNFPMHGRDGVGADSDPERADGLLRLAGAGRVPPRRAYLCAAAASSASAAASAAGRAESSADRSGAVRSVHGGDRQAVNCYRHRKRSGRRRADLSLDGANGDAGHAG